MIKRLMTISALVVTASLISIAPASAASVQDNIELCRTALEANAEMDMGNYRLRFKSKKGNRVTTLKLEAISSEGEPKKNVVCKVSRGEVIDVVVK